MIKHKQPQGVTRRRLDGPPTNNYEIRRVAGTIAILGYTERVNGGWRVRKAASDLVIESRGEHPHNRAMFWLAGDAGLSVRGGMLVGVPGGWDLAVSAEVDEAASNAATEALQSQGGQGFQVNPDLRMAIDANDMKTAIEHYYEIGWETENVHTEYHGYDLICRSADEVRHVEVKGTITEGDIVILTPNEVRHALGCNHGVLFLLSNIKIEGHPDGTPLISGGTRRLDDPWHLSTELLRPTRYRYRLSGDDLP
jgi:hypothetical protein